MRFAALAGLRGSGGVRPDDGSDSAPESSTAGRQRKCKWVYRHSSQEVCPYNIKFAQELKEAAFAPREMLARKNARQLARELLAMTQEQFSRVFKGSPMKRAKLRGLRRNAAVVLGNVGSKDDVPVLADARSDEQSLVRAHSAWALGRIGSPAAAAALRARLDAEEDAAVRTELAAFVVP